MTVCPPYDGWTCTTFATKAGSWMLFGAVLAYALVCTASVAMHKYMYARQLVQLKPVVPGWKPRGIMWFTMTVCCGLLNTTTGALVGGLFLDFMPGHIMYPGMAMMGTSLLASIMYESGPSKVAQKHPDVAGWCRRWMEVQVPRWLEYRRPHGFRGWTITWLLVLQIIPCAYMAAFIPWTLPQHMKEGPHFHCNHNCEAQCAPGTSCHATYTQLLQMQVAIGAMTCFYAITLYLGFGFWSGVATGISVGTRTAWAYISRRQQQGTSTSGELGMPEGRREPGAGSKAKGMQEVSLPDCFMSSLLYCFVSQDRQAVMP